MFKQLKWTSKDWQRVVFSDEKTFSNRRSGNKRVRKMRGEEIPVYTESCGKRVSLNCWGYITASGVGQIHLATNHLGHKEYMGILDKHLPEMKKRVENPIFMQDNAPFHVVNDVFDLFEKHQI